MATISVKNMSGADVGSVELADHIFSIEPNSSVMHEAVVNYLANQRQGTFGAKTRSEVRGGGRKPYRQKGTGRARQGTIRAPHYKGGGVVFAKKARDFSYRLPKKIRRLALFSACSMRYAKDELIVLDHLSFETPKTKSMVEVLKNLSIDKKVLFVIGDDAKNAYLSARNLEKVEVLPVNMIHTYALVNHDVLVFTQQALEQFQEVYQ